MPLAAAVAVVLACGGEGTYQPSDSSCAGSVLRATLPDAIEETSGVAASRVQPGVLWTHNDSGHEPVIFAIDTTGQVIASIRVDGATNRDWEDIAVGPCEGGDEECLFIGDIGDNSERHQHVAVYRVPEPDAQDDTVTMLADRIRFTYPDGPRDAESLYVDERGIHVIPKGRSHAIDLFRLPPPYDTAGTAELQAVQRLAPPPTSASAQVTAAAISRDAEHVVVRSYSALRFFHTYGDTLAPAGPAAPLAIPGMQRGEAVDFLADGRLILTGERGAGSPASLAIVRCQPSLEADASAGT